MLPSPSKPQLEKTTLKFIRKFTFHFIFSPKMRLIIRLFVLVLFSSRLNFISGDDVPPFVSDIVNKIEDLFPNNNNDKGIPELSE